MSIFHHLAFRKCVRRVAGMEFKRVEGENFTVRLVVSPFARAAVTGK